MKQNFPVKRGVAFENATPLRASPCLLRQPFLPPRGKKTGNFAANSFGKPIFCSIQMLQNMGAVAAMSHSPFISAASKNFFGIESWDDLPNLKDLKSIFEMPQYIKWRSFRDSEDARYVGLTLPRFLLRVPYGFDTVPAKNFVFEEDAAKTENFCWGNTAFAMAGRLTESFAKYRWCANIIGPQGGGAVEIFTGNWTDWDKKREKEDVPVKTEKPKVQPERQKEKKLKFSFKEQREFETIDEDIANLEAAIEENQAAQMAAGSDFTKLQQLTEALAELESQLEYKEERWMYLTELKEKIDAQSAGH